MQKLKVTFYQNLVRICTLCMAALAVVGLCLCTTVKPASAAGENIVTSGVELTGTDQEMYEQLVGILSRDASSNDFSQTVVRLTRDWEIPQAMNISVSSSGSVQLLGRTTLDLQGYTVTNKYTHNFRYCGLTVVDTSLTKTGKWLNLGPDAYLNFRDNSNNALYLDAPMCSDTTYLVKVNNHPYAGRSGGVALFSNGKMIVPTGVPAVFVEYEYDEDGTYTYPLDDQILAQWNYGGEILYGDYEEILAELNKPAACDHKYYLSVYHKETCTENGYNRYTCSVCNESYDEVIPATGHNYGDWVVDRPATASSTGHRYRECANCLHRLEESIPQLDDEHTHNYGEWILDTAPTTTTTGSMHRQCTDCDAVETVLIPKLPATTAPSEPETPTTPTTPTVKNDDNKVNVGAIAGGVSAAAVLVLGGVTAGVVTVLKRRQ